MYFDGDIRDKKSRKAKEKKYLSKCPKEETPKK